MIVMNLAVCGRAGPLWGPTVCLRSWVPRAQRCVRASLHRGQNFRTPLDSNKLAHRGQNFRTPLDSNKLAHRGQNFRPPLDSNKLAPAPISSHRPQSSLPFFAIHIMLNTDRYSKNCVHAIAVQKQLFKCIIIMSALKYRKPSSIKQR